MALPPIFRRAAERRGRPATHLVLGLGNPGIEYARTRHNVGAEVVELLADRAGRSLGHARKEQSDLAEVPTPGGDPDDRYVVAFPQTFMNDSGRAASLLVTRYGIEDPSRVVVVHDELDLDPGVVKVKAGGGLAGHNGLRSIKAHLGTDVFVRVRIGVGKPPGRGRGADHVLKKVPKAEREELDVAVVEAADATVDVLRLGATEAMNLHNGRSR